MEDFNLIAALVAGFVGTVVMSAMMTMAASAKVTDMPPMALVTGAMMTGDRRRATAIGSVVHYLMMGTVVFGIVYGLLFDAFDSASWLVGVAIGLAHGAIVGLVFMPMMPCHSCTRGWSTTWSAPARPPSAPRWPPIPGGRCTCPHPACWARAGVP